MLGPPHVRDMGLLSSALARPATVAFGVEAYEDIWTKAHSGSPAQRPRGRVARAPIPV